ncbi:MAG TPA: lipid-A-disaccharide synthase N-terminal domain-containing protein [Candidatus Paceibacterota bacterium]|jgi:Predicted membrane protein
MPDILHFSAWEIVGLLGAALFSGRWIVQVISSHKAGSPVVTKAFWLMSISGNILLLTYFIFGKTDKVGIISNSFPAILAVYNLWLLGKKSPQKYVIRG